MIWADTNSPVSTNGQPAKASPIALSASMPGPDPADGLTAVDFRAGLALLPILPMSPGDIGLIWSGLKRGSLVQFDRGDTDRLRSLY